jgi:GWxTD domain-containing protein
MRKLLLLSLILLVKTFAQAQIEFHTQVNVFYEKQKPYAEIHLSFNPTTFNYKTQADKSLKAKLEVTVLFKQNGEIKSFDKFGLQTKSYSSIDQIAIETGAMLCQKRYTLKEGEYMLDIEVSDSLFTKEQKDIPVHAQKLSSDKAYLSAIELVDTAYWQNSNSPNLLADLPFVKNAFTLKPYVVNFYPDNKNVLRVYSELALSKDMLKAVPERFVAVLDLYSEDVKNPFFQSTNVVLTRDEVVPIYIEMPIDKVYSGDYALHLKIQTRDKKVLAEQSLPVRRVHYPVRTFAQITHLDSIDYSTMPYKGTFIDKMSLEEITYRLNSIYPLAEQSERNYITHLVKEQKEVFMKGFYYNFWLNRNPNVNIAFMQYEEELKKANDIFGTPTRYGFETDRGRVYLQYGPPNTIQDVANDADALPYQVWNYYDLPKQKNVVFVFYTRDRSTNNYELIHSTARGERSDPKWAAIIQGSRMNSDYINMDSPGYQQNSGSRLQDMYGRQINPNGSSSNGTIDNNR